MPASLVPESLFLAACLPSDLPQTSRAARCLLSTHRRTASPLSAGRSGAFTLFQMLAGLVCIAPFTLPSRSDLNSANESLCPNLMI